MTDLGVSQVWVCILGGPLGDGVTLDESQQLSGLFPRLGGKAANSFGAGRVGCVGREPAPAPAQPGCSHRLPALTWTLPASPGPQLALLWALTLLQHLVYTCLCSGLLTRELLTRGDWDRC